LTEIITDPPNSRARVLLVLPQEIWWEFVQVQQHIVRYAAMSGSGGDRHIPLRLTMTCQHAVPLAFTVYEW